MVLLANRFFQPFGSDSRALWVADCAVGSRKQMLSSALNNNPIRHSLLLNVSWQLHAKDQLQNPSQIAAAFYPETHLEGTGVKVQPYWHDMAICRARKFAGTSPYSSAKN
jgi:hypothetical protein